MSYQPVQGATEVKIGLLTPKTGALGVLGITFENGANLAIEDLNAAQDDYEFSLVVQDTKTDPTAAGDAMTALATSGVIGVVGAAASSSTLAAMPIAKENEISLVSYASTAPSISAADDGDFLFRVVPSDAYQGQAAAKLADDKGYENVAVIGLNDAYGQGLTGAFKEAFEALGGTVTDNIGYEVTNQDFSSQISQIAGSSPDAIFMVAFVDDGALILDAIAANSALDGTPIIGTDGIATADMFESVSNSANFQGVIGVAPQLPSDNTFSTRYSTAYGTEISVFVEHAYDATMVIGYALLAAGEVSSCLVADNLRDATDDFTPITGSLSFDGKGDRAPPANYDFWLANNGSLETTGSHTVTGSGAAGTGPSTHCSDSDSGFLPFSIVPFLIGFVALFTFKRISKKQ
jgi:ABC-type branched-subunit amino acid transport system substrate-binding protein